MSTTPSPVTVFWRPGCPYCMRLRFRLHRSHLRVNEVDIWKDPDGAAFVRSVTGGDETVPTVKIGERALVNPSARRVLDEIRKQAPELLAQTDGSHVRPGFVWNPLRMGAKRRQPTPT